MASIPPTATLFEHVFPAELGLTIARGSHPRRMSGGSPQPLREQLLAWLCTPTELLEFELAPWETCEPRSDRILIHTLLDTIEGWLRDYSISPLERCVVWTSDEGLARALVEEMRRRYTGDPPPAHSNRGD